MRIIFILLLLASTSVYSNAIINECHSVLSERERTNIGVKLSQEEIINILSGNTVKIGSTNFFIENYLSTKDTNIIKEGASETDTYAVWMKLKESDICISTLINEACSSVYANFSDICNKDTNTVKLILLDDSGKADMTLYKGDYFNIKKGNIERMVNKYSQKKSEYEALSENPLLTGLLATAVVAKQILGSNQGTSHQSSSYSPSVDWDKINKCEAMKESCYAPCEGLSNKPTDIASEVFIETSPRGKCKKQCKKAYERCLY